MLIGTANSAGLLAFNRGSNRMEHAAEQIAKASMGTESDTRPMDLIKPVTELHQAELETRAAIKLLDVEDETLGTLLNLKV